MTKYWRRTIDSAQRRVTIEKPDPQRAELQSIVFDIQGATLVSLPDRHEQLTYPELAQHGIESGETKPLTIFQRLIRKPTPIGRVTIIGDDLLEVTLWSKPARQIILDVSHDEGKVSWREMEIMVRSAGFTFLMPEQD